MRCLTVLIMHLARGTTRTHIFHRLNLTTIFKYRPLNFFYTTVCNIVTYFHYCVQSLWSTSLHALWHYFVFQYYQGHVHSLLVVTLQCFLVIRTEPERKLYKDRMLLQPTNEFWHLKQCLETGQKSIVAVES